MQKFILTAVCILLVAADNFVFLQRRQNKTWNKGMAKSYDEYYFPYQNSFIIYEVLTETGMFCVLTFKSQGRVAFRFFDSAYNKDNFIDSDGKVFETLDKIRDSFGRKIYYTRIISSYKANNIRTFRAQSVIFF
jgi:hypothetical protein